MQELNVLRKLALWGRVKKLRHMNTPILVGKLAKLIGRDIKQKLNKGFKNI